MASRQRHIFENVPAFPPLPGWARLPAATETAEDSALIVGAALAALHPMASCEHPIGALWRQRLALSGAATLAGQMGRIEGEGALRDHLLLTRPGDDPGPAARLLVAWRELGRPAALSAVRWRERLPALFEVAEPIVAELVATIAGRGEGGGDPIGSAAAAAATSLRQVPQSRPLALWLADAVLAGQLRWPAPVPLLAAHLPRKALKLALAGDDRLWRAACHHAYARAGASAIDLYVDLGRRADRLLRVVPQLRGKDADMMVARLLAEDALTVTAGQSTSDRSCRRLFERLVALGGVRELTGRSTFRLYGL